MKILLLFLFNQSLQFSVYIISSLLLCLRYNVISSMIHKEMFWITFMHKLDKKVMASPVDTVDYIKKKL